LARSTAFGSGAGLASTNVAVPVGQVLIGFGLAVARLTRAAAFFGAVVMAFIYFVSGETGGWTHGPVTGELFGLFVFAVTATIGAGRVLLGTAGTGFPGIVAGSLPRSPAAVRPLTGLVPLGIRSYVVLLGLLVWTGVALYTG